MQQALETEGTAEKREEEPKPAVLSLNEKIGDGELILADDGYPDTDDFRMD